MKKLLTITALLAAGSASAVALTDIRDDIDGYDYKKTRELNFQTDMGKIGQNSVSYTQNWNWSGKQQIDLGSNNRYELTFRIYAVAESHQDPMLNIYLAGNSKSILYGNYVDIGSDYRDGAAGVFICGQDVSGFDYANGSTTCILNTNIHNYPGVPEVSATRLGDIPGTNPGATVGDLKQGYHTYTIYIEAFSDASQADLIHFKYNGANNGNKDGSHEGSWEIQKTFGIGTNEKLDAGVFFADTGNHGDIVLNNASGYSGLYQTLVTESRTVTPPPVPEPPTEPEPEPMPDVPEPSAFGLLAGIGALALVASRRRRK